MKKIQCVEQKTNNKLQPATSYPFSRTLLSFFQLHRVPFRFLRGRSLTQPATFPRSFRAGIATWHGRSPSGNVARSAEGPVCAAWSLEMRSGISCCKSCSESHGKATGKRAGKYFRSLWLWNKGGLRGVSHHGFVQSASKQVGLTHCNNQTTRHA